MIVELAGKIAFSALFKGISELIREVIEKCKEFKPLLEDIRKKLEVLQPEIEEIEKLNRELDRPLMKEFREVIKDGTELVDELKKDGKWYKKVKKPTYTDKLRKLDKSLNTQMMLLWVRSATELKRVSVITRITEEHTANISAQMGDMSTILDTILEMFKEIRRDGLLVKNQTAVGWRGVPEPPSFTVGLDLHLDKLKTKLLKDGVSMVLLTGDPGSGKTTLAKSFCQVKEVKDQFKRIFVNVSKRLNIEIVQEISEKAGYRIPCFQSEDIALDWLQQHLKNSGQDPVLLVLDDVLLPNSRSSLLAKFKESEMSNYKILATSRVRLLEFDDEYSLESLNVEDAMVLLRNSAGLAGSSLIPEDVQKKVVECCKGLPLFIEVVGRSLLGKDIVIWKERVDTWSSGSSGIGSEPHLCVRLQSSLDALGEENAIVKECFMDLAAFPQGQRIPAAVLIDMWAVPIDVWAAEIDSYSIAKLYELSYFRLANLEITRNVKGDNEMDDYYGEHFVTQHDLLRDLAIHQTDKGPREQRKRLIIDIRGNKFPKWWKKQMDQPLEQTRLLSISTDSQFTSKWRDIQLPKVKVLVLNFHTTNYALPEFVEKMDKLKVLIVTNHGFLPAEVSNFTLLGSASKLKRIRLERIWIPSIIKNPIELKRLQKISFFMCNIGQAFSNGSIKFFEAFPDLQEINIDYCSDLVGLPADLCLLIHLKNLSITNSHKLSALPERIGELANLEILRLRSCSDLLELPSSVRKLEKLNFLDISNCFSIRELPEHIGEMCCLQKLNMRQCLRLQELPASILNLEKLTEVICDEDTERLWEPILPSLENIQIRVVKEEFNLNWLQMLNFN